MEAILGTKQQEPSMRVSVTEIKMRLVLHKDTKYFTLKLKNCFLPRAGVNCPIITGYICQTDFPQATILHEECDYFMGMFM